MLRPLYLLAIVFIAISCSKSSDGINPEDKEKAAKLQVFLENNAFQLKKYYSETPIDYIDTDQVVLAETELWSYVKPWLLDDEYSFNFNGVSIIAQRDSRITSADTIALLRTYKVFADKQGVGFDFVNHDYQDLKYRLINFNDTSVTVSASWHGKTVISEFDIIRPE